MQYTTNYNFKKGDYNEFADIATINEALDAVDATLHECEINTDEAVKKLETATGNVAETARAAAQAVVNNKANKSTSTTATLNASDWKGTAAPYQLALSISAVTATNAVEITLGTATIEQATACAEAQIVNITQDAGSLTFYANGDKPTVDIPICVIIRGDL